MYRKYVQLKNGVIETSDSSLIKMPLPVDEIGNEFQIKSNRGVTTRRNKFLDQTPNTVAVSRRNVPGNKAPLVNRYSSPVQSKR